MLRNTGRKITTASKATGKPYEDHSGTFMTLFDGMDDGLSEIGTYLGEKVGRGVGTMVAPFIGGIIGFFGGGLAGSILGPAGTAVGATGGAIAGAGSASLSLNMGEAYSSFKQSPAIRARIENNELELLDLANASAVAGTLMASLDVVGMFGITKPFTMAAKQVL